MNAASSAVITSIPAIGQPWPGQGGIYAGISRGEGDQPDAHLIVATESKGDLNWAKALEYASDYTADDHNDFRAPTQAELALCYANLRAEFRAIDSGWYWTNAQYSAHDAWMQYFLNGSQYWDYKDLTARVRPVRRLIIQSFNHSVAPEAALTSAPVAA